MANNKEIILQWICFYTMALLAIWWLTCLQKKALIPPYHSEVPFSLSSIHCAPKDVENSLRDLLVNEIELLQNSPGLEGDSKFQLAAGWLSSQTSAPYYHSTERKLYNEDTMISEHLNSCSSSTSIILTEKYWDTWEKMKAVTSHGNDSLSLCWLYTL